MPDPKVIKALPTIIERLKAKYPDARYELNWENPLQLLVATILAAQCTDERVNQVTPGLFAKYPDARAYAEADTTQLEEDLKPTGFYRNKAKAVQGACRALVERFNGQVPASMEEMLTLPGVARKTANVVLNNAFRIPTGVIVDTHVARVSQRLGLTDQKKPEKIELDLMERVPKEEWITFGPAMVLHGRYTCTYHNPRCPECLFLDLCPKRGVGEEPEEPLETTTDEEEAMPAAKDSAKKTAAKKAPAKKAPPAPVKGAAKEAPKEAGPDLASRLPPSWQKVLAAEFEKPYFKQLQKFLAVERQAHQVFPPEEDVFNAFKYTPYDQVKVLLLGQDPYHDNGQAHGLAFSVRPGVTPPPSLVNIFKELQNELGCKVPNHGCLTPWARQGVMLLNAVLTVRAHEANSHKDRGWETFTDAAIAALNVRPDPVVFLLWGAYAQKKRQLIDESRHVVLAAAHPSPLSAKKFFGSKPFSSANKALQDMGKGPINWQLPDIDLSRGPISPDQVPVPGSATQEAPRPAASQASPRPAAASPAPAPAATSRPAPAPAPVPAPARPVAPVVVQEPLPALTMQLPADWRSVLAGEFRQPYFTKLQQFLDTQRQAGPVLPPEGEVFNAFKLTPYDRVRVVLLGEEPSAEEGESHGLAYSVREGHEPSETLFNFFDELRQDLGCWKPNTGDLSPWARQGVLLLNTVLTVRAGAPGSHRGKGWETFTDAVLRAVNARKTPVVFLLPGAFQKKRKLIDETRHVVVAAPDPDPDVGDDFVGSRVFSAVNDALELRGQSAIYWQLFGV